MNFNFDLQCFAASADNLLLGSGILYFDRIDKDGKYTGERDLGQVSAFNLTTTVEKITKYSNRTRTRTKYKEVVKQIDASAKATIEEFDPPNMALALYGEDGVIRQAATVGQITKFNAKKDRWFSLGSRNITNAVLAEVTEGVDPVRPVAASYTTHFTGANSGNLVFTASETGVSGNAIKITLTTSAGQALSVAVTDKTVNVKLAVENSSTIVSTAADVAAAINNNVAAKALLTATVTGGNGTGVVSALVETALSGGVDGDSGGKLYVFGKDYEIDEETGRVNILSGFSGTDGSEVAAIYDVPEKTFVAINGASVGEIRGRLRFVGDTDGPRYEAEFWNVSVAPDGELSLIGADDFASVGLTFSIEDDSKNHKDFPLYRIINF